MTFTDNKQPLADYGYYVGGVCLVWTTLASSTQEAKDIFDKFSSRWDGEPVEIEYVRKIDSQ